MLGRNTPGVQEGSGRYMVHFADNRPQAGAPIVDATEFTFYSDMSNIDFERQDRQSRGGHGPLSRGPAQRADAHGFPGRIEPRGARRHRQPGE